MRSRSDRFSDYAAVCDVRDTALISLAAHQRGGAIPDAWRVHLAILTGELRAIGVNEVGAQQLIQGKRTNWPHCNLCIHCTSPRSNFHGGEKLREVFQ